MTDDVKRALCRIDAATQEVPAPIWAIRILAAEVRRLQPLACEPCETCHCADTFLRVCRRAKVYSKDGTAIYPSYELMGGGCRAHKAKEGAK